MMPGAKRASATRSMARNSTFGVMPFACKRFNVARHPITTSGAVETVFA
ncbi:hypothetical protein LTSEALA_0246 [Salmonella enterica subsp. enterica serovar Alachua str. R6-377]|uniref:Uncharacterized protein n=1 Tax=Salmonella enterica subsp. enterica serovar Alachua str. R6-377 TaxID=913241 RepID=G5LJ04_SALET|nr:hypothetical protein LTSEALA_0246 [Salmonella enterica subsp. enterica serovar Alachua str. R6-377]